MGSVHFGARDAGPACLNSNKTPTPRKLKSPVGVKIVEESSSKLEETAAQLRHIRSVLYRTRSLFTVSTVSVNVISIHGSQAKRKRERERTQDKSEKDNLTENVTRKKTRCRR